ncbi:MAG: acyl carrier protein [Ruminococcaceae bacterium]|nr:acyl carrier protein [Oscillospiraceae bacterium]
MFETLKNILVEELQLDPEEIKPESELANDLGINSIELADLVMLCEDKFDIEIEDDDIHKFITINDVVKYLEAQQNK